MLKFILDLTHRRSERRLQVIVKIAIARRERGLVKGASLVAAGVATLAIARGAVVTARWRDADPFVPEEDVSDRSNVV